MKLNSKKAYKLAIQIVETLITDLPSPKTLREADRINALAFVATILTAAELKLLPGLEQRA